MNKLDQLIEVKLKEFEKEFCNNHQKPIRFLRSVFYDEQDGAEQIEAFLSIALREVATELGKSLIPELKNLYTGNATSDNDAEVVKYIGLMSGEIGWNKCIVEVQERLLKFVG